MLESISWSRFFEAVAIFIGCYYAIIVCLFWRDIIGLFRKRRPVVTAEPGSLMGPVRHTFESKPVDAVTSSEAVVVAPMEEDAEPAAEVFSDRLAALRDELLVEAGVLLKVGVRTTLPETAELFRVLFSNYPFFAGTRYQDEISSQIAAAFAEHTSFPVSSEEVFSWWTSNQ